MRLYFAGPPCFAGRLFPLLMAGRRVLASFPNLGRSIYARREAFEGTALDCGAFSTPGRPAVRPEDYFAHLERNGEDYDWYTSLDVIGDVRASLAFFREMLRRGLRPVPVFHSGEPWSVLEEYAALSPLVGLGSSPGEGRRKRRAWFEEVMARYPHRYHLFRATDPALVAGLAAESCDSSSWARAAAMGFAPGPGGRRVYAPRKSAFERAAAWVRYFESAVPLWAAS